MANEGFIQVRRGLFDHLRDGRLTLLEAGAFCAILLLADKATGIWIGSARALAAICGAGDLSDRQARHLLESLSDKGYIRRFPKRRSHANYPILVNRYLVTFGAYSGMLLNASETTDWRKPVYESRQEQGAEQGLEDGAEQGAERAPLQEVRSEKGKTTTPRAPKTGAVVIDLPDWLPREPWNAWIEMRQQTRKKLTVKAIPMAIRNLEKLRAAGEDIEAVIEKSTLNNWTGFYPVSKGGGGYGNSTKAPRGAAPNSGQRATVQPDYDFSNGM